MFARALALSAAGFLLGIFYASFMPLTLWFAVALIVSACIFLGTSYWARRNHAPLYAVFLVSACMLGAVRFDAARLHPAQDLEQRIGSRVTIEGSVITEPDIRERSVLLTVQALDVDRARILVSAPAFTRAEYGDIVRIEGVLKKPEPFESGEGRMFDYPMFLAARGIGYQMDFATVETISSGGNPLVRSVLAVKHAYISGLRAVLPEPYAGLAAGITAGDKRSVGTDLSNVFQRVSLVHILVLSGYNITVVMSMVLLLSARLPRSPKIAVAFAVVVFFILISGAAASSIRAGAMALAAVAAKLFGRQFAALRVLFAVAVIMVAWNPYVLAFDPGFQLSALATLGLVLFSEPIAAHMKTVSVRFGIREIISSTLATQVTVLPMLLYQNGLLSLVALPANMLALIAVPAAMAFSAVAALAGIVFGTYGTVLALPALVLLSYIVRVAELFARLPFAVLEVPPFSGYALIGVYACVGAVLLIRHRNKKAPAHAEAFSGGRD